MQQRLQRTDNSPSIASELVYQAILNGHVDTLNALIQNSVNIANVPPLSPGVSPLHLAASKGNEEIIRILVHAGIPVDVDLGTGETPLHIAALNKHIKAMKALLALRADINAVNLNGFTPLHYAVQSDDVDAVKALLEAGANPNIAGTINGCTPLHLAAKKNLPITQALLEAGANSHAVCLLPSSPSNALDIATRNDCQAVIPLIKKYMEEQRLLEAAKCGNLVAIREYIEQNPGTDLNAIRSTKGGTTLLHVAIHGGHLNIVEALLAAGASPNTLAVCSHSNKFTPLGLAVNCGHVDISKALITAGADIDATFYLNNTPYTPLQMAIENEYREIAFFIRKFQAPKFEERLNAIGYNGPIPDDLCCPITRLIMHDPLTVASGITFEREALIDWFKTQNNPKKLLCPKNGKVFIYLRELNNNPSYVIRNMAENFVAGRERQIMQLRAQESNPARARLFTQSGANEDSSKRRRRGKSPS